MKSFKIFALAFALVAVNARAEITPVEEPKEVVVVANDAEVTNQVEVTEVAAVKEIDIAC